jgi:hypothetical protein
MSCQFHPFSFPRVSFWTVASYKRFIGKKPGDTPDPKLQPLGSPLVSQVESTKLSTTNLTGWWYTYPSETYEFINWDDYSHILWKIKNVPNHQPADFILTKKVMSDQSQINSVDQCSLSP